MAEPRTREEEGPEEPRREPKYYCCKKCIDGQIKTYEFEKPCSEMDAVDCTAPDPPCGKPEEEPDEPGVNPCPGGKGYLGKQGCEGGVCHLLTPCNSGYTAKKDNKGHWWCCEAAAMVLDCIDGACREVAPGTAKYPEKCAGKKVGDSCAEITKVLTCVNGVCTMIDKRVAPADEVTKCVGKREGDKCGEIKKTLACVDGVCRMVEVATPENISACNGKKEGELCGKRIPCTGPKDCPPAHMCVDGYCSPIGPIECETDEDCKKFGEDYVCVAGQCVKKEAECKNDQECINKYGKDYYCYNGRCKKKSIYECKTDEDCVKELGEGYECLNGQCVKKAKECETTADCVSKYGEGYICDHGKCVKAEDIKCTTDEECPEGYVCKDGKCVEKEEVDGVGGEFAWSEQIKRLLEQLGIRAEDLLKYPRGLTPEERQAILNYAIEGIRRGTRGEQQSLLDRLSRTGMLGGGLELTELGKISRGREEMISDVRRELAIDEINRRFNELMQTTAMSGDLMGILMRGEEVPEALSAARRAEGRADINSMLAYLGLLMGGSQSSMGAYLQAILSQMGQQQGYGASWLPWLGYSLAPKQQY